MQPVSPTLLLLAGFLALMACGCVLGEVESRRPEIQPGRYLAAKDSFAVEYDFRADGTFSFVRTVSRRPTLTETGRWEYQYVGPAERYLNETEVTRRDLGSDSVWRESTGLEFRYRIEASTSRKFHLDPGASGLPGAIAVLFLLLGGSGDVVFHRQ